jgi:hypothetical protein
MMKKWEGRGIQGKPEALTEGTDYRRKDRSECKEDRRKWSDRGRRKIQRKKGE